MNRSTPLDWVWAYHVTHRDNMPSILKEGLKPEPHAHVEDGTPVLFVEPDLEGIAPYYTPGTVVLRFKTPGFGSTDHGESVLFAGAPFPGAPADAPFAGESPGRIPPERIQVLENNKFRWLLV